MHRLVRLAYRERETHTHPDTDTDTDTATATATDTDTDKDTNTHGLLLTGLSPCLHTRRCLHTSSHLSALAHTNPLAGGTRGNLFSHLQLHTEVSFTFSLAMQRLRLGLVEVY
jgi:hypothetical protein